MEKFNSKEDFYKYVEYLENLPMEEDSISEIKKFLKFSPNKFARKMEIDETEFQKKFNQIKKPLHLKVLFYKRIISLKSYRPELNYFEKYINMNNWKSGNWSILKLKKKMCICIKSFKKHGEPTFYETIYYSYCEHDNEYFIFDNNDKSTQLFNDEFNNHFIDYRDWFLNKILS
jgi:hypothetical protein